MPIRWVVLLLIFGLPSALPAQALPQKTQAALEAKVGLQLYKEHEDYRAITAMQRYRILDGSLEAAYLSHLIVGQIYHRNNKAEEAAASFDRAALNTEDDHQRAFAFLLGTQEECIALSFYFRCADRLDALADTAVSDDVRDLIDYQRMYTDVVLRSGNVDGARAERIRDPALREKARSLVKQDDAFDDLRLKSPTAAGIFSAVIPGTGQLYNGKPLDGLLAFTVTGSLGFATYYSIAELESYPLAIVSGLLALGFYAGNIINAVADAKRINASRYLSFFETLRDSHWARVRFEIVEDRVVFGYVFDWDAD